MQNAAPKKHKTAAKPRFITKIDCVRSALIYALLLKFAFLPVEFDTGFWPFAVFVALWGSWIPYHAVRDYCKIKATGKPIPFPLSQAWRRYYKGEQWSAAFSFVAAFTLFVLLVPSLHLSLSAMLTLMASFFMTPTVLAAGSLLGRREYRKAVVAEAAEAIIVPEVATPVAAPTASKHWWTDDGVRAEVREQKVGRGE